MKAVNDASHDAPMKRRRSMRRFAVLVMAGLLLVSLLGVAPAAANPDRRPPLPPPALAPVQPDALTKALEQGHLSQAEYALHRARSIFTLGEVRDEFGSIARVDPHSATLILRDLALRVSSLDGEDRAIAADILARPTQGGRVDPYLEYTVQEEPPIETPNFRIHYVSSTEHESSLTFATEVSLLMEEVWTKQVDVYKWSEPKADGSLGGGDNKFDVYLGNVGADFIYGYCSADPGQMTMSQHAYCVLDNGFTEFPGPVTGSEAAKVTAAHEFNHAIQFAYDITEDAWLFEATATWMEDEVFDHIDDNYQYLRSSSLARPMTSADTWTDFSSPTDPDTGFQYGQFIWMRYLSEKAADPSIVRRVWEQTAQSGVYSLEAIEAVLGGTDHFANSFADFAAVNAKASRFYEEGAGYEAVVKPVRTTSHTIASGVPVTGGASDVDHLTSRYISFTPGTDVASDASLTIAVNSGTSPMQEARVVNLAGTTMNVRDITLVGGEGAITVPFGGQTEVVLVLTNASNRMNNCSRWSPGTHSCGGSPADDNRAYTYSAAVGSTAPDPGEPGGGDGGDGGADTQAPGLSGLKVKPNPAVRGKAAKLFFTVTEAARLRIAVTRSGKKYLAGTTSVTAPGTYYVKWPIPKKIPTGRYTLKMKATDAAGNSSTAKKVIKIVK